MDNIVWVVSRDDSKKYVKRVLNKRPSLALGKIVSHGIQEGNDLIIVWQDREDQYTVLKLKEEKQEEEKEEQK